MSTGSSSKDTEESSTDSREEAIPTKCYFDCGYLIKQEILNLFSFSQKYLQTKSNQWVKTSNNNELKKNVYAFWCSQLQAYEKVLSEFLSEWETWPDCEKCSIFNKTGSCNHTTIRAWKIKEPITDEKIRDIWQYFNLIGSEYLSELILQVQLSRKQNWCKEHWTSEDHSRLSDSFKKKTITLDKLCKFFNEFVSENLLS